MTTTVYPVAVGDRSVTKSALAVTGGPLAMFTITGRVRIAAIYGYCSTVVGAGVTSIKLTHDPSVGTDTDISDFGVITALPAGSMVGVSGVFSDALIVPSLTTGGAVYAGGGSPIFLAAGTLRLTVSGGTTGTIDWTLLWSSTEAGLVVAA